jgi:hypothetical protein
MVEDNRVHLLRMSVEYVKSLASADAPDADGAIVRSTDESVAMSRDGSNRVSVASEDANEVGAVRLVSRGPGLDISTRPDLWKTPDSKLAVSGAGDNQRLLGLHNGAAAGISARLGRHQDLQATHSASVPIEDLLTEPPFNIPHANRSIGTTRNEHVAFVLQGPDATLVALQLLAELASLGVVDVNEGIVATCDDLVLVELEASDDVTRVSSERDVPGLHLAAGPTLTDHVVTAVQRLEEVQLAETGQSKLGVRHGGGCGISSRQRALRLVLFGLRLGLVVTGHCLLSAGASLGSLGSRISVESSLPLGSPRLGSCFLSEISSELVLSRSQSVSHAQVLLVAGSANRILPAPALKDGLLKLTRRQSVAITVKQLLPASFVSVNNVTPVLGNLGGSAEIAVVEVGQDGVAKLQRQLSKKVALQSRVDSVGNNSEGRSRAAAKELVHHEGLHLRLHRIESLQQGLRVDHKRLARRIGSGKGIAVMRLASADQGCRSTVLGQL